MSAADKHDAIVNINLAALHKKLNVLCTCKYFLKSDTCTEVIRYCWCKVRVFFLKEQVESYFTDFTGSFWCLN